MSGKDDKLKLDYGVVKPAGNAAFSFKTAEHTEVEVGDPSAEQFTPKLSLFKWNREVHLKLYPSQDLLRIAQVQQPQQDPQNPQSLSSGKAAVASLDENQIKHSTGPVDYRFYPLDPAEQMEDGGVEFEFTLNQKPDTNIFVFPIETRNLVFHYQPELTDEEKARGCSRPENVVGSYAVYHKFRGNVHNGEVAAQKYKTGKAFHIYRPKATDADGNSVWAQLNIDAEAGTLTVTVDQDFLDNAAYPVIIDPTFGYTGYGQTGAFGGANLIIAGLFTTPPGASNTAQKISVELGSSGTISHAKCGLYKDSDGTFLQETQERTSIALGGFDFYDFTFSPNYTLPDNTPVELCVWTDSLCYCAYDTVTGQTSYWKSQTYGSWPSPITWGLTFSNRRMSIYCTYTGETPLTVIASPHGSTSPPAGVNWYTQNQVVPVTATPADSNHVFDSWLVDSVNIGNANPYSITMDTNHSIQPIFLPAALGIALTDLDAVITWATPAHSPDTFYFGAVFGHFGIADLLTEATYQNGLATTAGYLAALKICRIAKVRGIPNAAIVAQQKAAMNGLPFFTGECWPITDTYDMGYGAENACLPGYWGFSNDFQLSNLLNYLPLKWNNHLAWQELEAVCHAAGDRGILWMNPINLHYYTQGPSGRFYDENALCINLLVELYMLDPDNNAAALTYALTIWNYLINNFWSTDHFGYQSGNLGFECSGGFFQQIIMKLYAANNYSLTNFANILTDLHTRYLASGWNSPQWEYNVTSHYTVVHMHGSNYQIRLENTLGAWIALHAFYPAMPTADKTAIVTLLNAATPAWKHLFKAANEVGYTLYDVTTGKFQLQQPGTSPDDPSTALAMGLLFLYGIVPDTGNLYIPLIHNDYEDCYTLNKYFSVDLANHKIRIPVKAGNLIFIYGTTPLTVAFAEDGVYDVAFSADWNMLSSKTKVSDLDPRLLYAVRPTLAGLAGGTALYKHYSQEIAKRGEDVTLKTLFLEDFVDDETGWYVRSFENSTVKLWMITKREDLTVLRAGLQMTNFETAVTQEDIRDGDRFKDGAANTFLVQTYCDHYYQGNFIYRELNLVRMPMII